MILVVLIQVLFYDQREDGCLLYRQLRLRGREIVSSIFPLEALSCQVLSLYTPCLVWQPWPHLNGNGGLSSRGLPARNTNKILAFRVAGGVCAWLSPPLITSTGIILKDTICPQILTPIGVQKYLFFSWNSFFFFLIPGRFVKHKP